MRLAPHFPEVLPEALNAARAIWSKSDRVEALVRLAPHFPEVLPEALEAARAIGNESDRAEVLVRLAPHLPEVLLEALEAAKAIGSKSDRAMTLEELIIKSTSIDVDLSLGKKILHDLATLNRPHFLKNLPNLALLIIKFGGVETLREITKAIIDVSRWWK